MPVPKGPIPPPLELGDDDDEGTKLSPPPDFLPAHKPVPDGAISLDDDEEDRTTIDKRPGRGQ
jgi:hypothetical protein